MTAALVVSALVSPDLAATASPAPKHHGPVLQRRIIGYSVEHRPIVAYHLGNPKLKRVSMILGQMHGDEHAGVRLVRSIVHGHDVVRGINLWVVPTMNPDGNAADTRQNAHGVDLNRNWPTSWTRQRGRYDSGDRPLSEPESQAMAAFLKRIRPHYLVSIHQPLDGVDTTDGGCVDPAFGHRLEHRLGLPGKALRCWSTCHGNLTRWYTRHHLGVGITVEFGASPSQRYLTGRARRGIVVAMGGRFSSS